MFFTYASRILSILALVGGFYMVLVGFFIAFGWTGLPSDMALALYAAASSSSGEAINKGTLYVILAAAMGTLAEISFAVGKKHN
jgi:hypothetical protein